MAYGAHQKSRKKKEKGRKKEEGGYAVELRVAVASWVVQGLVGRCGCKASFERACLR